jgi:uncharacterized protein (TIGR02246 family)
MNKMKSIKLSMLGIAILIFTIGCNSQPDKKTEMESTLTTELVVAKADMVSIKAEIQGLENDWAAADNARNAIGVAAFYSDDAISMSNNAPMIVGKAAIQKDTEQSLAKRAQGETVAYETLEVFGDGNTVTEIGTAISKDASGKVVRTGKYMAIWEKRDGKYICIRDIYNSDAAAK